MKNLTKKEIALLICGISPMGSDSDYWEGYNGRNMPYIMKRAGIKNSKMCGELSDSAFKKLTNMLNDLNNGKVKRSKEN